MTRPVTAIEVFRRSWLYRRGIWWLYGVSLPLFVIWMLTRGEPFFLIFIWGPPMFLAGMLLQARVLFWLWDVINPIPRG